jgi:hypothetical protein
MTEKPAVDDRQSPEAIQQSVARILVGVDGSLTIEAKPVGYSGLTAISLKGMPGGTGLFSRPRSLSVGGGGDW